MRISMLLIAILFTGGVAAAQSSDQEVELQTKCWLGSLSFTVGATARIGSEVRECAADGAWLETSKQAAFCFFQSEAFSHGATVVVDRSEDPSMKQRCATDGTWQLVSQEVQTDETNSICKRDGKEFSEGFVFELKSLKSAVVCSGGRWLPWS